jgi:hypothetical protein
MTVLLLSQAVMTYVCLLHCVNDYNDDDDNKNGDKYQLNFVVSAFLARH